MPAKQRGRIYPVKNGCGIRWTENGEHRSECTFKTKTAARQWFNENVAPRLDRRGPSADVTFDEFCDLYLERWGATVKDRTKATTKERLIPARETFGTWTLAELEHASSDIAAWRATLTNGSRFRLTAAMRQCLAAAVRWRYLMRNPAIDAGPNPKAPREELNPFTHDEIDALAKELGPVYGPLCIFAAETGLRTNEWVALERKDIDRAGPSVVVQRRFANGLTLYPKTANSRRRVPLTPRAMAAIDALPPRLNTPLLFPASEGGYIDLNNWRAREWDVALEAAGIAQRGPYHLRHSFATQALAAGVDVFALSRLMGTSLDMINDTYGHLANDSHDHLRDLLANRFVQVSSTKAEADNDDNG